MLVATDIAARGIDVEALGHVVNFDVPQVPEDYIHRVGRTARAELTGDAFTFVAPEEEEDLRRIERAIGKRLPRVIVPDFDYRAREGAAWRSRSRTASPRSGPRRRRTGPGPRPRTNAARHHRTAEPDRAEPTPGAAIGTGDPGVAAADRFPPYRLPAAVSPSAARSIPAMSSFFIFSIACIARSLRLVGIRISSSSASGTTCQDRPNLSLTQPHCCASHRRPAQLVPVVIDLVLRLADDLEGDRFGELEDAARR